MKINKQLSKLLIYEQYVSYSHSFVVLIGRGSTQTDKKFTCTVYCENIVDQICIMLPLLAA